MTWLLILLLAGNSTLIDDDPKAPFMLKYNENSIVEITGVMTVITKENWYFQDKENLVAQVESDRGQTWLVDIGPVDQFPSLPESGQRISARGSQVEYNGKAYLLSNRVSIESGKWMELRDERGVPTWLEKGSKSKFYHRMNRMRHMRKMR